MAKMRVLFVSSDMHVGGVTTALLSLIEALDAARYDIDLLLYENNGPLQARIPAKVRVLPQAKMHQTHSVANILCKAFSPSYLGGRLHASILEKGLHRPLEGLQIRSRHGARYSRRLADTYDLAISFIEFWPLYYTAQYVKARYKLAWIHVDYAASNLSPRWDLSAFAQVDRIVMVSVQCVENFRRLCPRYAEKGVYLPNLTSQQLVRAEAARQPAICLPPTPGSIRLVSTCRIQFAHKGLDRGVEAFAQLKARGKLGHVVWYIIGDGTDRPALEMLIARYDLGREIHLLGMQPYPLPIVAQCDAFFLPSRYEGKPIAVTEAMMLGLPAFVTAYASAKEQITPGVDGLIFQNSTKGIIEGLEAVLSAPEQIEEMRQQTMAHTYDNMCDVAAFERLIQSLA